MKYLLLNKLQVSLKYFLFTLVFGTLILVGCSKKMDPEGQSIGNDMLTFKVGGVNSTVVDMPLKASLVSSHIGYPEDASIVNISSSSSGAKAFDVVSKEEDIQVSLGGETLPRFGFNKVAAKVGMNEGVKYRVMAFNKNTEALIGTAIATVGTEVSINIPKDVTIRWVAYSYNNEEDIPAPSSSNPVITTPIDKPLLYASGEFNSNEGANSVVIVFDHKLTQLNVELDARGMFANMISVVAEFQGDYIKTSSFNLLTGQKTGQLTSVSIPELVLTRENAESLRVLDANYYTADPTITSYTVKFTDLTVLFPNQVVDNLIDDAPNGGLVTFSGYTNNNAGRNLLGVLKLWYVLPTKKIANYAASNSYGYGAEAHASGNFLRSSYNFGPTSKYMRVNGLTFDVPASGSGRLATYLADPTQYPDILICAIFGGVNAADFAALRTYLERGGVAFLMTESTDTDLRNFFRDLLGNQSITLSRHDAGGSVYLLNDVDPDVLDGVFGDVRGKYWGQDASSTQYLENYPGNDLVVYTRGSDNHTNRPDGGPTMFRHKRLNLFFVGDTGFLSNNLESGNRTSNTLAPFATVGGTGPDQHFPIPHPSYGHSARSDSRLGNAPPYNQSGYWENTNSIIFGNAFAWLLERAHFSPVDRSPL